MTAQKWILGDEKKKKKKKKLTNHQQPVVRIIKFSVQSDNVPIVFEIFVNAKDVKQVWKEAEKEKVNKK